MTFAATLVIDFFVALGMVLGGSLLGGIGASLLHTPPTDVMLRLSEQLKIWAMVSALGGTMSTLELLDKGVRDITALAPLGKQLCYLAAAYLGCQVGAIIIQWMAAGGDTP